MKIEIGMVIDTKYNTFLVVGDKDENLHKVNLQSNYVSKLEKSDIERAYKIYKDSTMKEVIWERKVLPQLSEDAKTILRLLPKEYKYIALDKGFTSTFAYIYEEEPTMENDEINNEIMWHSNEGNVDGLHLFEYLFKDLDPSHCYLIESLIKGSE